ncbi:proton-conducting transporter membrane subunit [Hippea maritima]|uniref:NADH dehydrogenase (Quinone) n=1 Tax=Hippea maritima (strain ATCC 700847 / DSM 10411 / MH2) TaxID=760142 RepID=F2LXF7_HIPMA|nr:proton-conducting transporter membrane subunit [Hippea maritima]AEA34271.1 NADH dehydrogenase (quinone) [Hippea maritima DSM 10411]
MFYYLPVGFSLIASLLCIIERENLAALASIIAAGLSVATSFYILSLPTITSNLLLIDGTSKIMLIIVSIIYLTSVLFSLTYLKHVQKPLLRRNLYYLFLNLFASSMLFSVILNNLGLIWVGIEATTITSTLLVAIDNDEAAIESSWRYIIIVSAGLIISLVGVVFIYASTHTLILSQIKQLTLPNKRLLMLGGALAIVGFATKAGIFPMHSWLADVHGRAIAPISAIFSAVLLPVALFGLFRVLEVIPAVKLHTFAFILGFLSVAFASIFLINQKFYKRMFAYSSIENMGMILIGLSLNTKYSLLGAFILLMAHAFAKSSAFYTTGNILAVFNSRKISDIEGLTKTMPTAGYNLVLSTLAVSSAPPFGTFLGEVLIIYSLYSIKGLMLTLLLAIFLLLDFLALNTKVAKMAFSKTQQTRIKTESSMSLVIPVLNTILAFLVIFATGFVEKLIITGMIK